jgi:hypothetical protein
VLVLAALVAGGVLSPPVTAEPTTASKSFVRSLVNRKISQLRRNIEGQIRSRQSPVFTTSLRGPTALAGAGVDATVRTLTVPPGSYLILAKLWWNPIIATSTGAGGEIDCDLVAESSSDTSREAGMGDFDFGTLSLQTTHRFEGPGTITLRCRDEFSAGNPIEVHNVTLTALEVGSITAAAPARGSSSASRADEPTR